MNYFDIPIKRYQKQQRMCGGAHVLRKKDTKPKTAIGRLVRRIKQRNKPTKNVQTNEDRLLALMAEEELKEQQKKLNSEDVERLNDTAHPEDIETVDDQELFKLMKEVDDNEGAVLEDEAPPPLPPRDNPPPLPPRDIPPPLPPRNAPPPAPIETIEEVTVEPLVKADPTPIIDYSRPDTQPKTYEELLMEARRKLHKTNQADMKITSLQVDPKLLQYLPYLGDGDNDEGEVGESNDWDEAISTNQFDRYADSIQHPISSGGRPSVPLGRKADLTPITMPAYTFAKEHPQLKARRKAYHLDSDSEEDDDGEGWGIIRPKRKRRRCY